MGRRGIHAVLFNCGQNIQTITPHKEGTTATEGVAAALNVTHFDIGGADEVAASILEACWLLDGSNISEELFCKRFGEKGNKPLQSSPWKDENEYRERY